MAAVTVAVYAGKSLPTKRGRTFNFGEPAVLTQNWSRASVLVATAAALGLLLPVGRLRTPRALHAVLTWVAGAACGGKPGGRGPANGPLLPGRHHLGQGDGRKRDGTADGLQPGEQIAVACNISGVLRIAQEFEVSSTQVHLSIPLPAASGRRDRDRRGMAGRTTRPGELAGRPGRLAGGRRPTGSAAGSSGVGESQWGCYSWARCSSIVPTTAGSPGSARRPSACRRQKRSPAGRSRRPAPCPGICARVVDPGCLPVDDARRPGLRRQVVARRSGLGTQELAVRQALGSGRTAAGRGARAWRTSPSRTSRPRRMSRSGRSATTSPASTRRSAPSAQTAPGVSARRCWRAGRRAAVGGDGRRDDGALRGRRPGA